MTMKKQLELVYFQWQGETTRKNQEEPVVSELVTASFNDKTRKKTGLS